MAGDLASVGTPTPGPGAFRAIAPAWVAADLAGRPGPSDAGVASVHAAVVNLTVAAWPHLLMVAGPSVYRGPSSVGLTEAEFAEVRSWLTAGADVRYAPGALALTLRGTSLQVSLEGPAASFAPPPAFDVVPAVCRAGLPAALEALRAAGPDDLSSTLLGCGPLDDPFAAPIADAFPALVRALVAGDEPGQVEVVRRLAGVGYGSTPTGDDLIHGALVAAHYLIRSVPSRRLLRHLPPGVARTTTPLGSHMIEIGTRGLTPDPVRGFLLDVLGGRSVDAALRALDRMGADSGRAVAVGAILTITALLDPAHEGGGTA